ncbi:ComEA family DNA-binding protein [Bifidobacterium aquikefiricola]|uniref:Helix-hairpin-helix domain-containing protein n=1 Tax=Bifidobacterium aquikefiricola TaxID=3059038 RepID=A0AB39U4P6_9BIFI
MDPHATRLHRISEHRDRAAHAPARNHSSDHSEDILSELTSTSAAASGDHAHIDDMRMLDVSDPQSPLAETVRNRPRLVLNQAQAIIVILILSCALAASLTLLVRQRINYGNSENLAELAQDIGKHSRTKAADSTNDSKEANDGDDAERQPSTTKTPQVQEQEQEQENRAEADAADTDESTSSSQAQQQSDTDQRINLNTADAAQLMTIKGIGPVTAERILEYRKKVGTFRSVDELLEVSGIGAKTLEKLRPQVTIR